MGFAVADSMRCVLYFPPNFTLAADRRMACPDHHLYNGSTGHYLSTRGYCPRKTTLIVWFAGILASDCLWHGFCGAKGIIGRDLRALSDAYAVIRFIEISNSVSSVG